MSASPGFIAYLDDWEAGSAKERLLLRMRGRPVVGAAEATELFTRIERLEARVPRRHEDQIALGDFVAMLAHAGESLDVARLVGLHARFLAAGDEETCLDVYRALGRAASRASVTALLDLMEARPDAAAWDEQPHLYFVTLPEHPELRDVVFPRIESLLGGPKRFESLVRIANAFEAPSPLAHRVVELAGALASADDELRPALLQALSACGPAARESLLAECARGGPKAVFAAGALAMTGDARGVDALVAACAEPRVRWRAVAFLEAVKRGDRVPAAARAADVVIEDEVRRWLEFPTELGRPPDALELVDTRLRRFAGALLPKRHRLFRYTADGATGTVLQGPVTFGLSVDASLPVEQIYAAYDAWGRAQKER